ncbi:hypothetical protein C8J56DRAFT_928370 [Mycena floridula]|nr:hypothetical protein C8J56DRAFT_928370 [Mycena floridula]
MSLDENLFTLIISPSKDDPNVVDLVDGSGSIYYRKQRIPGPQYTAQVYDFFSQSLLVSATGLSASSKVKTLELYNPNTEVELKHTGTISFRWSFKWEEHEFEWKREECFLIRKPDPPVMVAITKQGASGRLKTTSVQILDYNLNRFDVDDRKGLEIVILTALLTFQDFNEAHHNPTSDSGSPLPGRSRSAGNPIVAASPVILAPPPPPPPKPEPKTGIDRIAEVHAIRGDVNEVTVEEEGSVKDYAQYCSNLLLDEAMLFVTVRSGSAEQVPKVIQIVDETKRIRHKAGIADETELYQYVMYDTIPATPKGPKRINLNDTNKDKAKNKYTPPNSLIVHLSKISMPELQPKPTIKINEKPDPKSKYDKVASPSTSKSGSSRHFLRRSRSKSPPELRVPSHKVHPNQPSPSPSQLGNPAIYVAPLPLRHTRPVQYQNGPGSPAFPTPSLVPPLPPRPSSAEPTLYGHYVPESKPNVVTGFFDMLRRT